MSSFCAPVATVRAIESIPNADAIELAVVGEYRSVVRKGQFHAGQQAIYLPESAVLPDDLLERLGLIGKLAGSNKNRIKAVRLRGCLSQGILYSEIPSGAAEGDDMAAALGVIKYEPPVPASMNGELASVFGVPLKYDIENFKAFPNVLQDGEIVEMTEKAHGTFCAIAVVPGLDSSDLFDRDGIVYSKGLGGKGLVFKNVPGNATNIYVHAAATLDLHRRIRAVFPGCSVHVLGELYGNGVQDLTYGRQDRSFAAFDISINGVHLARDDLADAAANLGLDRVPVLYRGPFSSAVMHEHTNGSTVLGRGAHIREGVVITPVIERRHDRLGRVILKSVSPDYLLRKGDTTEFS